MSISPPETNIDRRIQAKALLEKKDYAGAKDLLEKIFDGREASVATNLGYIYGRSGSREFDPDKAISYYKVAAEQGSVYAQHALGGLFRERGQLEDAIHWYGLASQAGSATCSYNLFKLLLKLGETDKARDAFNLALSQGDPIAAQTYAIECILGRHGLHRLPSGLIRYFRNIPNLVRFRRENS
jgi:TPR repeat protein